MLQLAIAQTVFGVASSLLLPGAVSGGIISDKVFAPPDYDTLAPPAEVGGLYTDPVFGIPAKRLTLSDAARGLGASTTNSEISYFNADGTLLLATDERGFGYLYDGRTGAKLKELGRGAMRPWWMRWSPDPKRFYAYEGNQVRLYNVDDLTHRVLRRFDEYKEIGPAGGEGDVSDDGRYWCLNGDDRLFVYDLIDDKKHPESPFPWDAVKIDYAMVSCSGKYVLVLWRQSGSERYCGTELYDREWNFLRQLLPWQMHSEVAYDADGNEILVTKGQFKFDEFNSRWKIKPGDIIAVRLADGRVTCLLSIPTWAHTMFSACNSVTTPQYIYAAFDTRGFDPAKEWAPYFGEIVEIPTDGSQQVRRLIHHRSQPRQGISAKGTQCDFVVNRQGTKIVFQSNFGRDKLDLYMFDIPPRE